MSDLTNYIELGPVRVGAESIAEMDEGRALLRIPREQVVRIDVCKGSAAERPLVSVVLGLVLLLLAAVGPLMIALAVVRDVNVKVDIKFATSLAFAIPAVWLLDLALRHRWYLRVSTKCGARKLLFARNIDAVSVEQFVAEARSRFGYSSSAG